MSLTARLEVQGRTPVTSLQDFFKNLLAAKKAAAVFVAEHLPMEPAVMPTLVTDPERLDRADPLAPAFPMNGARLLSRLTRKPLGERIAVVLRPCEIRAFIELVKLKQGSLEDVVLIGIDCLGAYGNLDYPRFAGTRGNEATLDFYQNLLAGKGTRFEDFDLAPACKACEVPVAENADVTVGLIGMDLNDSLLLASRTEKGECLLEGLGLTECAEPVARRQALAELVAARTAYRDAMFAETSEATADLEKLMRYLARCVNCYNCRVACPVCYCRECVFVTDVFDHEPEQYLRWAKRKGILKMPTDTVFYHLTRLAHMSTACIGCGQCSNACPNHVPVMELFRTVAHATQQAFGYQAGRSAEEPPPLSIFREKEFSELTGGKD